MTTLSEMTSYRDSIVQITRSVFETMLGLPVEPLEPGGAEPAGALTAAVYYAGEWRGALLVECSEEQAAEWSLHLMRLTPPLAPADVRDGLGELANVVAGNLKALLPRGVGLSIPSIVQGSDYSVSICGGNRFERVSFTTSSGPFRITLVEVKAEPRAATSPTLD